MSEDYRCGFNTGYQEGYKTAKDEARRLEVKVSELEEKLGRRNTTLKTVEKNYLDCLDKIKELEKIIAESTSVTLTVGFISMDARVNCITTGQFIDLNDDEDNTAYLEVHNPESPNKRTVFVFKNGDIQTFRNLIRRQLSLGKNYVQFKRSVDSSKEEK